MVEINSTYYGLPKPASVKRWAESTPANFRFLVKAHGDTTHKRETNCREVPELLEAIAPLRTESKLAGILAQFPASFRATGEAMQYIDTLQSQVGSMPLFVEFRHSSWDSEEAVQYCRGRHLGWVAVDLPPIRSLMPIRPAVTVERGYVRLHGRNAETWYDPTAGDRYDWNYTEDQLREWLPRLHAMVDRTEETYLFFNNCHAGQAIKNAALMREIMRQEGFDVV
jgi:uncharacterized protein YecE (DUF72 family)